MFQVWQSVKVKTESHARFNTAGVVFSVDPSKPDEVGVRFDLDSQVQLVAVADLQAL